MLARGCNNKELDEIFKNPIFTDKNYQTYFILLDYNLEFYKKLFSDTLNKPNYILDGFYHGNTIAAKNKALHTFFINKTAYKINGYIPYKYPQYYTLNKNVELINFYQGF